MREKCPKYGVFSGPYFPVFGMNTGKYRPEKTPYFDTFHAATGRRTMERLADHCGNDKQSYIFDMYYIVTIKQ